MTWAISSQRTSNRLKLPADSRKTMEYVQNSPCGCIYMKYKHAEGEWFFIWAPELPICSAKKS